MAVKSKSGNKKRIIMGAGNTKFKAQISESSKRYLMRQAKDPYTSLAREKGYASRAAFKLIEIDEKHNILKSGFTVVDLGAAPGGWSKVVTERNGGNGKVFATDILPMDDIAGVDFMQGDFTSDEVYEAMLAKCPNGVDTVISDMAPNTSGHAGQDHLRSMMLCEMAADFALQVLKQGGSFAVKMFQGGEEVKFRDNLRKEFEKVTFFKPKSSRKDSREIFLVALGKK